MKSSDLCDQVASIREALVCLPEARNRFDRFAGELNKKMTLQPDEAASDLLEWLKTLSLPVFTKDEVERFTITLERGVFCSNRMNYNTESFSTFRRVTIQPLLEQSSFSEAACQAWKQFIDTYKRSWKLEDKHERSDMRESTFIMPRFATKFN